MKILKRIFFVIVLLLWGVSWPISMVIIGGRRFTDIYSKLINKI